MLDVFLNYACQAKCPFCYNPPLTTELKRWRLPEQALARSLLSGRREGYQGATFSGGEVTLLRELPLMLRMARKTGYKSIGIISNGLRLSDRAYLEELAAAGLTFCCLSIHGAGPDRHDAMVAVPGAFEKVLKALDHLRVLKMEIVLNFVMTRKNCSDAAGFIARFAPLPISEFQLYLPHYEGLMAVNAAALALSIRQAAPHLLKAVECARALGVEDKLWIYNIPPCALPELSAKLRNWQREENSLLVDPQGLGTGEFRNERRERFKNDLCRSCALDASCLGFERGYVERFGEIDFQPLATA